jgi:hypothetical protein
VAREESSQSKLEISTALLSDAISAPIQSSTTPKVKPILNNYYLSASDFDSNSLESLSEPGDFDDDFRH